MTVDLDEFLGYIRNMGSVQQLKSMETSADDKRADPDFLRGYEDGLKHVLHPSNFTTDYDRGYEVGYEMGSRHKH